MMPQKKNTTDFIEYLKNEALSGQNIAVKFDYNDIQYLFYFQGESLLYATNSILPNERLERHLKSLSHKITGLKGIWQKINQELEENPNHEKDNGLPPEYHKIIWLAEKKYLNPQQLNILGKRLSQEILESLLLIETIDSQTVNISEHNLTNVCQHSFTKVLEEAEKKLEKWQTLAPEIQSTYQRPYLVNIAENKNNQRLSQANKEKLARILKGFNFRQLGALLNQDEFLIAQRLYPLIKREIIVLKNPKPEFELLPKLRKAEEKVKILISENQSPKSPGDTAKNTSDILSNNQFYSSNKNYKIACIDDSVTVLKSISEFLNQDNISVFPITNAAKAMMLLNRIKPDLIFMDIGMPLIDGYKLCSLLRKNSNFSEIPIIMLTGNTGIINRAKAKMSGATDYMTKPFTQDDLLKIVFRYLSDN